MKLNTRKFIAALALTSTVGQGLLFTDLRPVQAQDASIPTHVKQDDTKTFQEIVKAGITAAANSAFRTAYTKFLRTYKEKFGIKSALLYQDALVESKTLVDSLRSQYGNDAVSVTGSSASTSTLATAGTVLDIVNQFEALPLNTGLTGQTITDLAIKEMREQNPEQRERNIQKLIVGASAMFSASISCGGINERALDNTARYLAAASTGVRSRDINPRDALRFYQDMARFGNPYSSKEFWKLELQSLGSQHDAKARKAAELEMSSPGLKASQTRDGSGRLQTNQALNLISVGQENANAALYNFSIFASTGSTYDSSSFTSFATSVISEHLPGFIAGKFGGFLGDLLGDRASKLQETITKTVSAVSTNMVNTYVKGLFEQVANDIFQGEVISESNGCRGGRPGRAQFDAAERQFQGLTSQVAGQAEAAIIFSADPEEIIKGETVKLTWDASLLGENLSVTLTGGGVSGPVADYGNTTDKLDRTTTYTLRVTGPNGLDKSASITVNVDDSVAIFEAMPTAQEKGRKVRISWNIRPISDSEEVLIFNPATGEALQGGEPDDGLPTPGLWCYGVNSDVQFEMQVPTNNDDLYVQTVSVSALDPSAKDFSFDADDTSLAPGETATISWGVSGYDQVVVRLNGQDVGFDGSQSVGPGTYTLEVAESNGCGTLAEQTIVISSETVVTTSLLPRE
ncbi:MAG: hypothetical protein A3G07_00195 [Candidatus Doudnabacteria bacterium RIFCSPLOWO2_12_FULL_47_12]|nr:MAG: hypothetical protein A3G07_00195 [Candidatus Doudnabacteria bacterium RIFCSPLOWO2_12_FULL_47_12]